MSLTVSKPIPASDHIRCERFECTKLIKPGENFQMATVHTRSISNMSLSVCEDCANELKESVNK